MSSESRCEDRLSARRRRWALRTWQGLAVGVWKYREELQSLWHCDVTFEPQMEAEKKEKLLRGWHKAVGRSLDWEEH